MREKAEQAFGIAGRYAKNNASAALCYADAVKFYFQNRYHMSIERSMWSLKHSVGIFHDDFNTVASMQDKVQLFREIRTWLREGRHS